MNPLLKTILIMFISNRISVLLLNQVYKIKPKLFSFIEKIPEKMKGKLLVRWIIQLFLITIVILVVDYSELNDTIGKILIGFLFALTDFVFDG